MGERQSLMTLVAEHFRVKERCLFHRAGHVVCLYKGFRLQPMPYHLASCLGKPARVSTHAIVTLAK